MALSEHQRGMCLDTLLLSLSLTAVSNQDHSEGTSLDFEG